MILLVVVVMTVMVLMVVVKVTLGRVNCLRYIKPVEGEDLTSTYSVSDSAKHASYNHHQAGKQLISCAH